MSFELDNLEFPGIIGFGPEENYRKALNCRMKPIMDGGVISIATGDYDWDVFNGVAYGGTASQDGIFSPYTTQNVPDGSLSGSSSRAGNSRFGYGRSRRHNIKIFGDKDFIVKVNSHNAKSLRWLNANGVLDLLTTEVYNLYLRSANQTDGNAQVQVIDTVAVSALTAGDYFYLPGTTELFQDETFGIYVTIDGVGDEPTDALVTTWAALALVTGDTNANVATKLDTLFATAVFTPYISSAVASNNVTVTHDDKGPMRNSSDGVATTGFTFNTPSTPGTSGETLVIDLIMS